MNDYRMMNDTLDILDAYVIDLGIQFQIRPQLGADKYSLLDAAIVTLQAKFQTKFYIGEPLYISDIYSELNKVTGILDVTNVKITNKIGAQYAATEFDVNSNLSPDGSYVICPNNCIFQIKFPLVDIKGKIV